MVFFYLIKLKDITLSVNLSSLIRLGISILRQTYIFTKLRIKKQRLWALFYVQVRYNY